MGSDHYVTLGIAPGASAQEVQRAYRRLARRYHPDLAREPGAEERFRRVAEAYEVLRDPASRKRYDASRRRAGATTPRLADFIKIFSAQASERPRRPARASAPAPLSVSVEQLYEGARVEARAQSGESFSLDLPRGATHGSIIEAPGRRDRTFRIEVLPHERYRVEGLDLVASLALAPWEAALGAKVGVKTLGGPLQLVVPAGLSAGARLRLRGRGLRRRLGERGALYMRARIVNPPELTERERALYEELARISRFDARAP